MYYVLYVLCSTCTYYCMLLVWLLVPIIVSIQPLASIWNKPSINLSLISQRFAFSILNYVRSSFRQCKRHEITKSALLLHFDFYASRPGPRRPRCDIEQEYNIGGSAWRLLTFSLTARCSMSFCSSWSARSNASSRFCFMPWSFFLMAVIVLNAANCAMIARRSLARWRSDQPCIASTVQYASCIRAIDQNDEFTDTVNFGVCRDLLGFFTRAALLWLNL